MKDITVKIIIVLMLAFALMLFIFSPSAAQVLTGNTSSTTPPFLC